MSDITVAGRYAVALFQIAKEQNLINQLEEELRIVNDVFTNDKELLNFLAHPKMTSDAKIHCLQMHLQVFRLPFKIL